ncbi:MAG: cytidylate kinase-like family protein [Ruminococcaceae bacterium]|nr:cytidylate kinase-like family protein [Oscillospiraceae bacterium]
MNNYVITVGREHGSGGHMVARKLAELLGIPCYDKEMITLAAKKSGLSEDIIKMHEQKKTSSFLYSLQMSVQTLPISDMVYIAQSNIIKDLAKTESCVIVGRCADYILKDFANCFNIFVYAPFEHRMNRVRDHYGCEEKNLERYITRKDRERADYYQFNTHMKWGDYKNYDLLLNSKPGIDATARIAQLAVKEFFAGKIEV